MLRSAGGRGALLAAALFGTLPVAAQDRPFLATWRAMAEEDDDEVWEFEAARWDNRFGNGVSGGLEIAYRHLFNHIDRDGWCIGVAVAAELARPVGQSWPGGG